MSKAIIDIEKCKGCALCTTVCPKKIIVISSKAFNKKGNYPAEVTDMSQCIGCAFCARMCPDCAITVYKGEE